MQAHMDGFCHGQSINKLLIPQLVRQILDHALMFFDIYLNHKLVIVYTVVGFERPLRTI